MAPTAASAKTAFGANTTILLAVVWVVVVAQKNSHLKLILRCFFPNSCSHTKFHPNRTKNIEVENFRYWSVLVGRAGRSKNGRRHFKLILCCFWAIISPHTKFHPNRTKNTEVENFHYWSVLVGWAGSSKPNELFIWKTSIVDFSVAV